MLEVKENIVTLDDFKAFRIIRKHRQFTGLNYSRQGIDVYHRDGPNRDPWGTPDVTTFQLEEEPLTTTRCIPSEPFVFG